LILQQQVTQKELGDSGRREFKELGLSIKEPGRGCLVGLWGIGKT
jgi:hypothetical protein